MNSEVVPLEEIIELAYTCLAFDPGGEPDWAAFNACFHEKAVLALRVFPADSEVSVMNLEEYARKQMSNNLSEQGYSETQGEQHIRVINDVAVVTQEFTMNFAGKSPQAAIDVFSLARFPHGWRIVSVISEVETT